MIFCTKTPKKVLLATTLALASSMSAIESWADSLGLALVLDGSGSINRTDFGLQTGAYQSIFQDNFYTTFLSDFAEVGDSFHVAAYQFSGSVVEEIGFMEIDSDTAAYDFGAQFASITQLGGGTNTAAATSFAASALVGNNFDRKVIDISTDGVPNNRASALTAAENASTNGVHVNALGVGDIDESFLETFTEAGDGFYLTAANFSEFSSSLSTKLSMEISPPSRPVGGGATTVPEIDAAGMPIALGLLGCLVGLFRERRIRRSKR